MVEDPEETHYFKYKVLEIVEKHFLETPKQNSNTHQKHVTLFQSEKDTNIRLADKIWNMMVSVSLTFFSFWSISSKSKKNKRTRVSAFDPRIRVGLFKLYKSIWGIYLPSPLRNTRAADPNLLLARDPTKDEYERRLKANKLVVPASQRRSSWSAKPTTKGTLKIKLSKNEEELFPHAEERVVKRLTEEGEIMEVGDQKRKKKALEEGKRPKKRKQKGGEEEEEEETPKKPRKVKKKAKDAKEVPPKEKKEKKDAKEKKTNGKQQAKKQGKPVPAQTSSIPQNSHNSTPKKVFSPPTQAIAPRVVLSVQEARPTPPNNAFNSSLNVPPSPATPYTPSTLPLESPPIPKLTLKLKINPPKKK